MEIDNESSQDSDSPWGPRVPVTLDSAAGFMSAGVATRPVDIHGDVDMALSSYLSMVYELRSMTTGVIPLREEDILVLSNAFEMEETDLAERLARLMHCDDLQTHRFIQMVKKGRVLVPVSMVAAGALLAASLILSNSAQTTVSSPIKSESHTSVAVVSTTVPVVSQVSVDIGDAAQVQHAAVTDQVAPSSSDTDTASNPPPDLAPGQIDIGNAIIVSRDDPQQ